MKIIIFGLSITSSWGNGHATTYRALAKGLHRHGHTIVFFEHDLEWYSSNRDCPKPEYCQVVLFDDWKNALPKISAQLKDSDLAVVGSYFPDGLSAVQHVLSSAVPVKAFYDIDTPITVAQLRSEGRTPFLNAEDISGFDIYFSFTGGPMLQELERNFGAQRARPLYCSFDPSQYRRRESNRYRCDLSYMGTYAPDRQPKIDELLVKVAQQLPQKKFIVAGPQYPKSLRWPKNLRRIQHLNPRWHPHLYSSSRFTLNVTRRDMVQAGYSPSVRLFEAAACGATIVSDNWPGLDTFFAPGSEILLPQNGADVKDYILNLSESELRRIGNSAQQKALQFHTCDARARQFEAAVDEALSASAHPKPIESAVLARAEVLSTRA